MNETAEQLVLAQWLDIMGLLWFHTPNEIQAPPSYLRKRRRLGVKPGVPDVVILDPPPKRPSAPGCAIELKQVGGHKPTTAQCQWLADLGARGWLTSVAYGADDAIRWLTRLGYVNKKKATGDVPERPSFDA